jgi:serine/threonine protein phosphatase PrpC
VLLLLLGNHVYIAGVGDSRGVLGSLTLPEDPPALPRVLRGEAKEFMDIVHQQRAIRVETPVKSVQLTKDQKPEDIEELIRIFRCGGRVMRLPDETGKPEGPYLIFKPDSSGPGLAFSRSIGNTLGTDLGVIHDPVLTRHTMNWDDDLFMICASDGVWDVMENDEVVAFLERYRHAAQRNVTGPVVGPPASCTTATIAQMICEEARTRWFSILEHHQIFIADISCVVVEFRQATETSLS